MQPSIPPIGRRLSFFTSQVDLTHSDDYHYSIEVKTIVVMLMIFTMGGIDGNSSIHTLYTVSIQYNTVAMCSVGIIGVILQSQQ